jgi:MoxR-like ATPase
MNFPEEDILKHPLTPKTLLDRVDAIRQYVNRTTLEREKEVEGMLLALASGTSAFLLGDVGTSKTRMIEIGCAMFGLDLFNILLSETTKPEHVFGPTDIPALARGIQRVKTKGYAPTAHVLFFDEMFKASGVVLNPLLGIMNEHTFRNGDAGMQDCPTMAVFAASNEIPTDAELRPVYDRLLLRYQVQYIRSAKNLNRMIDLNIGGSTIALPRKIHLSDVHKLRSMCASVHVPLEVRSAAIRVRDQVQRACQITISDRRLGACMKLIQASSLLKRRKTANIDDVEVLAHAFWDSPEQITKVAAIASSAATSKSADLQSYEEVAKDVWDTALQTGDMAEAEAKLAELMSSVRGFQTSTGKQVARSVYGYLSQARGVLQDRENLVLTVVPSRAKGYYLRMAVSSASSWSAQQLRAAGFHWRIKGGWWWMGLSKDERKLEASIHHRKKVITHKLGVKPKIRRL